MSEKLLNLLKDPNHIKCWYPCSGDDFEATALWTAAFGNTAQSNLFILTDSEWHDINDRDNTIGRLKRQGFELSDQITLDNMDAPMDQIDWRFNAIEWNNVSENEFIEIILDGALDAVIKKQDKAALIELIKMGMVQISDYVSDFNALDIEIKTRILKILNRNQKSVSATLYKKENALLIFIQCENFDFFNYCMGHEIIIDGAIVIRHEIDRWLYGALIGVFIKLKTKYLMVYLNQCNEEERGFFIQHQIGKPVRYGSYSHLLKKGRPDELIFAEW